MNTVIKQISEIESAAASVMDDANARKKAFAQEMAEKTAAFDREAESQTQKKIQELRSRMEVEMESKLSRLKTEADAAAQWMEENYKAHHTDYAKALYQSLIKE